MQKEKESTGITQDQSRVKGDIMTFKEFCTYTGLSESTAYKITSGRKLPYYRPNGGKIYFLKNQVDEWILSNPIQTYASMAMEVATHTFLNKLKGGRI